MSSNDFIAPILALYDSASFRPPASQYTVVAAFFLTHESPEVNLKVISLGTGTKCLPTVRLPLCGEALHDSHAEVLARRGAIRWFLEEIGRSANIPHPYDSPWIGALNGGKYQLREGVKLHLYISTVPCGDASTRFLASLQDAEMAALKDSAPHAPLSPNAASRGRNGYARLGVLRTKPGRADSPPTLCMSCSDKIASWNVLGFQGALASRFLGPLYLSTIIIGEVPSDMQGMVKEDCERAFWGRVGDLNERLPSGYALHKPSIHFTDLPFPHSRTVLDKLDVTNGSCNESLCWIDHEGLKQEILINGLKRGVAPKHRYREKSRPQISKIAMFQLHNDTLACLGLGQNLHDSETYYQAKQSMSEYQAAKDALMGELGPFSSWVRSGKQWESFDVHGESIATPEH